MNMHTKHTADATTVEEGLAIQESQDKLYTDEMATQTAMQNTLLTPRFYTTDFDELDAIDVSSVREDWDKLIAQMVADPNKGHFKKNEDWDHIDWDNMEPQLKKEFIDFLISSCTAEFSGCVLYKEMKRRGSNKDITQLFQLMARDEARHAGFINDALREAGLRVNLGFLTQKKKYTYFRPKFIYYATYLSEKIGYARYITIFRHLEANPQHRFHPIFKWFKEWCNDEFSHGEAFALLMKTDPKLTSGGNVWWIKFFLTAVYATMYVRDHQRPAFHEALGVDPDWYAHEVFTKTSKLSEQIFPITLDIDHPRWQPTLERLQRANADLAEAKARGGLGGRLKQISASARAVMCFVSLYTIPAKSHRSPTTCGWSLSIDARRAHSVRPWQGANPAMTLSPVAIALIATCLAWWISTGAILVAVRLSERGGPRAGLLTTVAALPLLLGGAWGYWATLHADTTQAAYTTFLAALALWGWVELSFLTGAVTGPVRDACPPRLSEWARFLRAWGTVAHHELLLTFILVVVIEISWGAPNQFGLWTFVILYFARVSAKLNLFLGVAHVNTEFFPRCLSHLSSHFGTARMNWLFPASITALTFALACWLERLVTAQSAFAETGYALLCALTALALLEHWFLVLPLPDAKLWRWMLPKPRPKLNTRIGEDP